MPFLILLATPFLVSGALVAGVVSGRLAANVVADQREAAERYWSPFLIAGFVLALVAIVWTIPRAYLLTVFMVQAMGAVFLSAMAGAVALVREVTPW